MTSDQKEKILQMRSDGASYGQMASCLGISKETIKSFCRRNSVQVCTQDATTDSAATPAITAVEDVTCRQCAKRLIQKPKQKPRRFCSDECRLAWWRNNENQLNKKALYTIRCAGCGQEFESYGNKARKYCGHACYIKNRFGGAAHDQRAV